jgi:hypothetical protein
MQFRTGQKFEEAVFGHSAGRDLFRRFGRDLTCFGRDLNSFIKSSGIDKPPTKIGACLYHQVVRQLNRFGINPEGLVFLPSVDTAVDLYGVDGLFFLPSLFPHLVTIDAFNTDPRNILSLKESWIDSFGGEVYSDANFQSDLFLYKKGISEWRKDDKNLSERSFFLVKPPDFRRYAKNGRPENHFVLTPVDVGTYQRRKGFAKMVAGYFAKVSGHKMAQLSP